MGSWVKDWSLRGSGWPPTQSVAPPFSSEELNRLVNASLCRPSISWFRLSPSSTCLADLQQPANERYQSRTARRSFALKRHGGVRIRQLAGWDKTAGGQAIWSVPSIMKDATDDFGSSILTSTFLAR